MLSYYFLQQYILIYVLVFLVQGGFFLNFLSKGSYLSQIDNLFFLLFIFLLIFLTGFRNFEIGTDTLHYVSDYEYLRSFDTWNIDFALERSRLGRDPLFALFSFFLGKVFNATTYIFILSVIFYFSFYFFVKKITNHLYITVLFSFLCFFFFLSFGINILRAGISVMFVLLGFSYFVKQFELVKFRDLKSKQKTMIIICITIGVLFHSASWILVLALIISRLIKLKTFFYIAILIVCLILAIFKFTITDLPIVGPLFMMNERTDAYLSGDGSQLPSGVNVYILFFQGLIILYYLANKKIFEENSIGIIFIRSYLILCSFYMLCLNISFSDRFGIYSWVLMPLILSFPILFNKSPKRKNLMYFSIFSLVYFLLMLYRIDLA
ncbi:EpsG family protein [Sphingobacterium cellulitidis]|uniref:EpsG family protein n=1 Tax=Sphingobacterium cellulitidis TaxID=1768011 RepID=UPI000B9446BE|nr:hypothetical protein CHT99_11740 [Sphingobacterium cellulitidis]